MSDENKVYGVGPLDAKLMVIGDMPGKNELIEHKPFCGKSGATLRKYIRRGNVNPDHVRYDYLCETYSPTGRVEYYADPIHKDLVEKGARELKERIKAVKPNVVLCLGELSLQYIMGRKGLQDWMGFVIWNEELNCKCIATYDPASVVRNWFIGKGDFPGQFEALFSSHIDKACAQSLDAKYDTPQYTLLLAPTFQEAMEEMEELEAGNILSIDIETCGQAITCIGFAGTLDRACSIPILRKDDKVHVNYWPDPVERVKVFRKILQLVTSDLPKVIQNSCYDGVMIASQWGFPIRNIAWDTLCAANNLYCELPKDLGSLMSLYTKLEYHKHMAHEGTHSSFWEYNARDALANLHIMKGQIAEMQGLNILNHYRNHTNLTAQSVITLGLNGVKVDEALRLKAANAQEYYKRELLNAAQEIVEGWNPKSPVQNKSLFYDVLGCRPVYRQGKISAGAAAMETVKEKDKRNCVQKLAELVIRYGHCVHDLGVLNTPLKEGRIYSSYHAAGTESGRLASKKSNMAVWIDGELVNIGTNLQNLKKGIHREMIIPG